jgi:hypothetical protein
MSRTLRKLPERVRRYTLLDESNFQMIDGVMFESTSLFGGHVFRVHDPRGDNIEDHVRRTNAFFFTDKYKWGYPWLFRHFRNIQERRAVSQALFHSIKNCEEDEFMMPIILLQ